MGTQLPSQKGGRALQFSAHFWTDALRCHLIGMEVCFSPGDVVLDGDQPHLLKKRWERSPQFSAHVYCGQTAGWMKMPLNTEVCLDPDDIVLDRDPAPPKNIEGTALIFSSCPLWQTAVCFRIPLGTEVGLSLGNIVLDGDPAPLPQNGESRQFSANVRCGQTAGCIKMQLGTEVNLGPGDVMLEGVPAPSPIPRKRGKAPSFRPMSIVAKRLDGWRRHLVRK